MAKPFDVTLNKLIDGHLRDWGNYLAEWIGIRGVGVHDGDVLAMETDLSLSMQADRLFHIHRRPSDQQSQRDQVIHLELESSSHRGIPDHLLEYNVAASKRTPLPIRSVVLLLRPSANASDLTGVLQRFDVKDVEYLTFRYTVIRLWEESCERLLNAGPGLAPLALLTNEAVPQLGATLEEVHRRLQQSNLPRSEIKDVLGSTFVLCGLRYEQEQLVRLFERFSMTLEDSTTYQWILNQGLAKGLAKGRTEGHTEGRMEGIGEGRLEEAKRLLITLGARRLGTPTADQLATIHGSADLLHLEQMIEAIFTSSDWATLLLIR